MDVVPSLTRQVLSILLVFALLGVVLWKARRGGSNLALTFWRQASRTGPPAAAPTERNFVFRRGRQAPLCGLLFRRLAAPSPRALERVERLALTQHHAVHLIRVQGRDVLVATHPQGCTVLSEVLSEVVPKDAA